MTIHNTHSANYVHSLDAHINNTYFLITRNNLYLTENTMEFAQEFFYTFSNQMRKDIITVQHVIALAINTNHSRIRSMR